MGFNRKRLSIVLYAANYLAEIKLLSNASNNLNSYSTQQKLNVVEFPWTYHTYLSNFPVTLYRWLPLQCLH